MFVYGVIPGALQTTNAAANTANDCFFLKPGATRTLWVKRFDVVGRGGGLSLISGLVFRFEQWTTTSSSGGTAITPGPHDGTMPAATATAAFAVATVTSGTGGPVLKGGVGCGAAGPGSWVGMDMDAWFSISAAANQSLDVFNASATASLNFEVTNCEIAE